jgi:AcrR family transcriptional regulator
VTSAPEQPGARDRVLAEVIEYFARHGIGDVSLRSLAAELGTSHRMLIYHFGSRDGLLAAVVDAVERDQRTLLAKVLADGRGSARARSLRFWTEVTDAALIYGPLFFELSGQAMQGRPHAATLRDSLIAPWLEALEKVQRDAGFSRRQAQVQARTGLALARGLLFDLLLTGDRAGVDAAMRDYVRRTVPA